MLPAIPFLVQAGLAVIASYGGYVYYDSSVKQYEGSFDIYKLKFNLNFNVFGQTEALNSLVNHLGTVPLDYGAEAIILYGGVGVGKTLALSLVRENYEPGRMIVNVMQHTLEDENLMGDVKKQVASLARITKGVALVTVDNADISSIALWHFIEYVNKLGQQLRFKAKVVVAAQLFRDSSMDSVKDLILNSFKNEEEYTNYIVEKNKKACTYFKTCKAIMFRPVSLDMLKMCINASAKSLTRMDLNDKQMEYLIGQISEVGLDYIPGGCKSVENYVALLSD